jgi:hypothetical protein
MTLAACGGDQQISRHEERGWAEHMVSAEQHEQRAAEHEQEADAAVQRRGPSDFPSSYACGDPVLNDTLTTGGVGRVTNWVPCVDVADEYGARQYEAAENEKKAAQRDRRMAADLVRAEMSACKGIPPAERDHSLFAHRTAVQNVFPHKESGLVRGVWIELKPGLSADYVRRDIACQRARWAVLGPRGAANMPDDPTLVAGADVQVFDRHDHVDVLVRTDTVADGEVALARAEGRLAPSSTQTAVR